jgi:F-type H+-transporting ATPase subunit gamma
MANLRTLVRRRKAVGNIRRITRTMELIATARFKKALDRAAQAEAYTRKLAELAADLSQSAGDISHPLLSPRPEVKNVVLLVIGSNRGLCGGYNASIIREASHAVERIRSANAGLQLEIAGRRPLIWARFRGIQPANAYTQFEDKPAFADVEVIANRYLDDFSAGRIDRLDVAYMKFLNPARQMPVVETLLPLSAMAGPKPTSSGPTVDYEFLPDAAEILAEILPDAFKARLFKCFLDAAVSEQIARRVAMKAATENAADLIKRLSREYNRARQARITKEIAEVIGGAAALE